MSASPEFYKPAAPAFSPPCAAVQLSPTSSDYDYDYCASSSCRTPTGSGIAYLREPTTCPPAPRKPPPPPCRKRLFQTHAGEGSHKNLQPTTAEAPVPVISLRLDELERLFRPHPPPTTNTSDKRRRSARILSHDSSFLNKASLNSS